MDQSKETTYIRTNTQNGELGELQNRATLACLDDIKWNLQPVQLASGHSVSQRGAKVYACLY
eukprot:1149495-Pelagomonas_calceolata.AAC.15